MTAKFLDYDARSSLSRELHKMQPYYRRGRLVYAPVFKAASSYYTNLLEHNGWESILYTDVNWDHDHVFGFIMDPIKRYFKGLAQDLSGNIVNGEEFIEANEERIVTDTHFLLYSYHTLPISTTHADHYYYIDWIPLDSDTHATVYLEQLLEQHDIKLNIPEKLHYHPSTDKKVELYEWTRNLWRDNNLLLLHLLKDDIELYNKVMKRFTPLRRPGDWNKTSWLR
jgi:hypothetical protein